MMACQTKMPRICSWMGKRTDDKWERNILVD